MARRQSAVGRSVDRDVRLVSDVRIETLQVFIRRYNPQRPEPPPPGTGLQGLSRQWPSYRGACLAVGETVILLHPPSPLNRCFDMNGKGVPAK